MKKTYNLVLDIKKVENKNIGEFVQGDINTSVIEFSIIDDGISFDLTGKSLKILCGKPDHTTVIQDVEIINALEGVAKVTLNTQALTAPGYIKSEIQIYENEKILTTSRFGYIVRQSLASDKVIESTNEFPILTQKINEVNSIRDQLQEQLTTSQNVNAAIEANEDVRNAEEYLRVTNETERAEAENIRLTAEEYRESTERTRIINETARIENETERDSNEVSRVNSEETRTNAEIIRENSESIRISNENIRISNENTRKNNEAIRSTSEEAREANETNRVNAENTRIVSENDRINQFNVIKNNMTLFDVQDVAAIRNSITLNPSGSYNYVSGNVVTNNTLTILQQGQSELNFANDLQVSNEKIYSKTTLGKNVQKMIKDLFSIGGV